MRLLNHSAVPRTHTSSLNAMALMHTSLSPAGSGQSNALNSSSSSLSTRRHAVEARSAGTAPCSELRYELNELSAVSAANSVGSVPRSALRSTCSSVSCASKPSSDGRLPSSSFWSTASVVRSVHRATVDGSGPRSLLSDSFKTSRTQSSVNSVGGTVPLRSRLASTSKKARLRSAPSSEGIVPTSCARSQSSRSSSAHDASSVGIVPPTFDELMSICASALHWPSSLGSVPLSGCSLTSSRARRVMRPMMVGNVPLSTTPSGPGSSSRCVMYGTPSGPVRQVGPEVLFVVGHAANVPVSPSALPLSK
mmetsp:Transcript_37301/g.91431  ORF Transcript_37301/g.91431 Transcript_37301/m.91431 type:complete len:308 (+) Transcript_37301:153-1076(+)